MKPARFDEIGAARRYAVAAIKFGLNAHVIDLGGLFLVRIWSREGEYA